jgi:outer membrane protein OmpA-like peptidoglycan-associated protein/tetratricopeptide (TPR) repeat protein
MKRAVLILLSLVFGITVHAQSKKELIVLGDNAYKAENYGSAIYFYRKVILSEPGKNDLVHPYEIAGSSRKPKVKKDSTMNVNGGDMRKVYVIHKLAESYRQLKDYSNAEFWYKIAVENPSSEFPNAKYYYAVTLMNNEKYDEAEKILEAFIQETGDENMKKLAEGKLVSCAFARNPANVRAEISTKFLDTNFNRGRSSFAINYFTEGSLIFANAHASNIVADPKKDKGEFTSDLYIVALKDSVNWEEPVAFTQPVNSPYNEGGSVLSVDRSTFYFTRWNPENRTECDIYVSKRFNRKWMEPMKLDINVAGYKTMMPMLNLDETKLFFASNRPGGQGGMDIWYCPIDADGNLGDAVNCGPVVNTAEDEVSPFYHLQTNTLYFSSTGHPGFGGQDVFKTQYNEDEGIWTTPYNLGAPVNTSKDERYFIIGPDQRSGFYASDRLACSDCDSTLDLRGHCEKIWGFDKEMIAVDIQGYVYDANSEEPIPGAIIELKDVNFQWEPIVLIADENGFYKTELRVGMEIFMKSKKTKYFADAASVNTLNITETAHLQQDFYLRKIPSGEIEIPGIEYDFDRATLRPKSKEVLDQLYDFLTLNSDLVVEIKSHTDCRGNDAYNMKLSKDRAKSCVDYLISKGIAKERLVPQGYGETEPLFKCDDIAAEPDKDKQDELHQRNRRTAFRVVKQE